MPKGAESTMNVIEAVAVVAEKLADATIEITQKAKEMLLGENLDLFTKTAQGTGIIQPDTITAKELFYDQKNEVEITRLTSSLQEEHFCEIQSRLSEKGLPKGIAVLLYGAPGTGKTETVYQLAKSTGRMILYVDISKAKSCWFGESDLTAFAENYNLSGGQIDNIVRKVMMDEVLTGMHPDVEILHELCKHEKIGTDGAQKIGFSC